MAQGERSNFLCFPLALACLLISVAVLVRCSFVMQWVLSDMSWSDASRIVAFVIVLIQIILASFGILAVLCKWAAGADISAKVYQLIGFIVLLDFLVHWWHWGFALAGKEWHDFTLHDIDPWKPTGREIAALIIYSLLYLLVFWVLHVIKDCFRSLANVYRAGGSGWSYKKAQDYRRDSVIV